MTAFLYQRSLIMVALTLLVATSCASQNKRHPQGRSHAFAVSLGVFPQRYQSVGHQMKTLPLTLVVLAMALTSLCDAAVKNVVLVHGAFADGSGWKPVAELLERDGYTVYVVQNPLTSFDADVVATRIVLDRADPCVLVGHSWGGMIITEAGNHASVRSLVYVNAFQPDLGETAGALQKKTPPAATSIGPVGGGFLAIKQEAFRQDFAADLPESVAHFMSISQVPIAV